MPAETSIGANHNPAGYARMRPSNSILANLPSNERQVVMNPRQQRGLVIAATQKLTQKGKVWLVPSQTGKGKYTVCPDSETPYCSCPDHEETGGRCKHIYAVEVVMQREVGTDGTITETRKITLTEQKTYRQPNWPLYTLSQVEEKRRFQALLHDLCQQIPNPPENRRGRKRTSMADMIFAAVLKVYGTFSSRRSGTDLDEAHGSGYVSKKLHPVMVCSFLENAMLTPVLRNLITASAAPLRAVETEFAVDSSGFSTSRHVRWTDEKYGVQRSGRDWVKAHIACGIKTHVVTAVEILDRDAADCPQFKPLLNTTAERFKIGEVSADKAYLSVENIEAVFGQGGTPFIAFKINSTGSAGGLYEKMFHYYSLRRAEYMDHYHKRSNVESVFSMVKAKFRDDVRSKNQTAMKNEVLCKLVAHNICCLIRSQVELGIDLMLWGEEAKPQAAQEVAVPLAVEEEAEEEVAPVRGSCIGA